MKQETTAGQENILTQTIVVLAAIAVWGAFFWSFATL